MRENHMNKYQKQRKFTLDSISAMIDYAESINKDRESIEYQSALSSWMENNFDLFKETWEQENGKLEDTTCPMKNTKK